MDVQIVLDGSFFNICGCDNLFLFYFYNMEFGLFQNDGLTRQLYNLFLFHNVGSLYLNHLNMLSLDGNNFFSLDSLDINLHNILFIEYWFLCNYSNWTIHFDWNLNSLLYRYNLIYFYNSINYPISNKLIWNLMDLFYKFLFHNLNLSSFLYNSFCFLESLYLNSL